MFDIGWSEFVVIAVVALIAIGPKELPGVLRMVGQWMGKARKMAAEFQGQFNEAMREAEMADVKKAFDEVKEAATGIGSGNIMTALQKDVGNAMKIDDIDTPTLPKTPEPPTPETFVEAETHAAAMEPLAIVQETPVEAGTAPPQEPPVQAPIDQPFPPQEPDLLKDAKAS